MFTVRTCNAVYFKFFFLEPVLMYSFHNSKHLKATVYEIVF